MAQVIRDKAGANTVDVRREIEKQSNFGYSYAKKESWVSP